MSIEDAPIDFHSEFTALKVAQDALENKMRNHLHVILTNALNSAQEVHVGMCLFNVDHAAQKNLSDCLSANLTTAEVARQALKEFD